VTNATPAVSTDPGSISPLLGLFLTHANDLLGDDLSHLTEAARVIDRAGIDYVVVADHVVLSNRTEGHAALGAPLPFPLDEPYPEPLMTLMAIAAVTSRVRLATGIFIAPLRPPVLVAKMVATLAALSNNRFDFGVGSGWQEAEFDALGVPIADKVGRLDDCIMACQALWRDSPASFASATVSFDTVACSPRPSVGSVPVWFAGTAIPATLRRVARLGSGWLPLRAPDQEELIRVRALLAQYCEEYERDAASIGIRITLPTVFDEPKKANIRKTVERVSELGSLGVTGVQINIRDFASSVSQLSDVVAELRSLV
jgi:probable F420-dependent oxidoreductase